MKFHVKLPGGAELSFEREPMEPYKFYTVCWAIVICIVAVSFFGIFK